MTEEQLDTLITHMQIAKQDNVLLPKVPLNLFKALNAFVSLPVVEVILVDNQRRVLLTYRQDEDWNGWHIPGGFMGYTESIPDACSRIALKELGSDCTFTQVVHASAWENRHPYGAPVSIFCKCSVSDVKPLQDGTFFESCPKDTIAFHKDFLKKHWEQLTAETYCVN